MILVARTRSWQSVTSQIVLICIIYFVLFEMSVSETKSSDFFEPGSDFPHPIGDLLGFNGRWNTFSRLKDAIMHVERRCWACKCLDSIQNMSGLTNTFWRLCSVPQRCSKLQGIHHDLNQAPNNTKSWISHIENHSVCSVLCARAQAFVDQVCQADPSADGRRATFRKLM